MAAYAVANICLIVLFVRRDALPARQTAAGGLQRWLAGIALLYVVVAVVGLVLSWSSLAPMLRVLASFYLLLLVGMATTAVAVDIWAGIGAALFFASQILIAVEVAGHVNGAATSHRLEVMVLYMLGILLIAAGVMNRELRANARLGDGIRPERMGRPALPTPAAPDQNSPKRPDRLDKNDTPRRAEAQTPLPTDGGPLICPAACPRGAGHLIPRATPVGRLGSC